MKKLIAVLLCLALIIPVLSSCHNDKPNTDTTISETEKQKDPEIRKSKPYPNAMKVSAYSLLTDSEKTLYEAIAKLLSSPQASKSVNLKRSVDSNCFEMILDIFKGNFGTHDAVIENISYIEADGKITAVMIYDDFDEKAFKTEYEAISKKADEIISGIPLGLSDREILFQLIDYIVANTEHVSSIEKTTVYTTLMDGKACSAGFAKTLDFLLKKLDIPSFIVYGFVQQNTYDKDTGTNKYIYEFSDPKIYWNYISLWNKWYKIDITKLYPVWEENGELFLDLDNIMSDQFSQLAPYYFYRNDIEKMQIPMIEQWSNNLNIFNSCDDFIKLLESVDLTNIWNKSYESTLIVKFRDKAEADKLLEYDKKTVTDKTGIKNVLYISRKNGEQNILQVTPIRSFDNEMTYSTHTYKPEEFVIYNSEYHTNRINHINDSIILSYDIPECWVGENGYYKRFDDIAPYPGFVGAMSFLQLTKVPGDFVLNEWNARDIISEMPTQGLYKYGETADGHQYLYCGVPDPYHPSEIHYYFNIRITDNYLLTIYIWEYYENEDIVFDFINSVSIVK